MFSAKPPRARWCGPVTQERHGEGDVERAENERAPCHPVLVVANEGALKDGGYERHSEDQGSVDDGVPASGMPQREDDRDRDIEEKEDREKGFRRREVLGTVSLEKTRWSVVPFLRFAGGGSFPQIWLSHRKKGTFSH